MLKNDIRQLTINRLSLTKKGLIKVKDKTDNEKSKMLNREGKNVKKRSYTRRLWFSSAVLLQYTQLSRCHLWLHGVCGEPVWKLQEMAMQDNDPASEAGCSRSSVQTGTGSTASQLHQQWQRSHPATQKTFSLDTDNFTSASSPCALLKVSWA